MELLLLALLAVQCARLFWALVTPLGPIGDWKPATALRPVAPASPTLLGSFDPFFRLTSASNAPVAVTSLNLKLFGVREDRASGRGSAIIGTPDGQQRSFAVGDEISPGVTLTAVGFDNVTISRAGTSEQIFLDQSSPASGDALPTTTNAPGMLPVLQTPAPSRTTPPVIQVAPGDPLRPIG